VHQAPKKNSITAQGKAARSAHHNPKTTKCDIYSYQTNTQPEILNQIDTNKNPYQKRNVSVKICHHNYTKELKE
jgi:hypothetical protein